MSLTPDLDRLQHSPAFNSGGWIETDPLGGRNMRDLGILATEQGSLLDVTMAYETWGTLSPERDNAVLVLHALTGDSHVQGPATDAHPTAGWWDFMVGPGKPIDTDRFFVVAPNVLGGCQGTTGPSSLHPAGGRYGSRFPAITIRDQVEAEHLLMKVLGLNRWAAVVGGSMGGMRALEWAICYPEQVECLVVIAASARATADFIALNTAQIAAIETHPGYQNGDYYGAPVHEGGPLAGLGVARRIAHTMYRTANELEDRFSNTRSARGSSCGADGHGAGGANLTVLGAQSRPESSESAASLFAVASYLEHHAAKLCARFDPGSYVTLVEAMNSHDIGRGRGGVAKALGSVRSRSLVMGIESDRLFPVELSREIAKGIANSTYREVSSSVGHDAFLLDIPEIKNEVESFLIRA